MCVIYVCHSVTQTEYDQLHEKLLESICEFFLNIERQHVVHQAAVRGLRTAKSTLLRKTNNEVAD